MKQFDVSLIALSVDPHADRYWWVTPYAYCNNNPIKIVDPDGRDIWTIYEDGTINRQEDKTIDRIDVIDKDGNTIQGTEAKYGTITQRSLSSPDKSINIDLFEIDGNDLAKETFENIANNTSIEWTWASIGKENSGKNIVGTSHDNGSTAVGGYLRERGYTLKEVTHNHPNGNPMPSGVRTYDETGKKTMDLFGADLYGSNTKLNIYTPKYGYSPYNSKGSLDPRIIKQDGKYMIKS